MTKTAHLTVALFIVSSLFHVRIININLNPYDEAVMLVGAERILNGEVPYKDFFSMYTPGQYYAIAALFKIFGVSVIVERIYDIAIKSLLSIVVFLIIRLVSSNKYALTGWVMSLIWAGAINFPAYPVYPALLFIYISIYLFMLHLKENKTYYIDLCAVSIVLAIFFRHDLGGLAAIIIAFVLILGRLLKAQKSWAPFLHFIGSAIAAGVPVIIYFFFYSDTEAIISNLIIFPLSSFQELQSIPYPRHVSLYTIPFFIFPLVLLIGIPAALLFMKRRAAQTITYGTLLISFIGIAFFKQASARSDIVHLLPLGLMSVLLAPVLLSKIPKELLFSKRQYRLLVIFFIAVFGITLYKPLSMRIASFPEKYAVQIINPDIKRVKYTRLRDQDIKTVASYIKKSTSKNEYIYSGLKDHDALLFNDALIYFLAERKPATKYHEMNPGFTTDINIQRKMVDELKDRNVRLLVLTSGSWNTEAIMVNQQVDVLDNYISTNYQLQETIGQYELWMRKS